MLRLYLTAFCALILFGMTSGCKHQAPLSRGSKSSPTITTFKPAANADMRQRMKWMIGYWHGDQPTKTEGRKQWIAHREADGRFSVIFKMNDPVEGDIEQTESGIWGLSGNYFATHIHSIGPLGRKNFEPPLNSDFWDIYQIDNLTENELHYRSVETGNQFRVRRVTAEFKMTEM